MAIKVPDETPPKKPRRSQAALVTAPTASVPVAPPTAKIPKRPSTLLHAKYVAALTRTDLLRGFSSRDVDEFVRSADVRPRECADRDILCRRGERGDHMWVVLSGRIDARVEGNTITSRGPGELVGEQALIEGSDRSTDLIACGLTEILCISDEGLQGLPDRLRVRIWQNLARIESVKLRQATATRSDQTNRDRRNQGFIRAFLNLHQEQIARAQGDIDPDHPHLGVESGWYVIIFTDLVGFSRFAKDMPDNETAAMIRDCMEAQTVAFEKEDVLVDKFMGDGLMAYMPLRPPSGAAKGRACKKALSAAFAAREAIRAIRVGDQTLSLRLGLHIGQARAGNFGARLRMQVTLIGDQINYAARLEQAREDDVRDGEPRLGDIRVSDEFFAHLAAPERELLPHRTLIKAKQADIWIQSGPAVQR